MNHIFSLYFAQFCSTGQEILQIFVRNADKASSEFRWFCDSGFKKLLVFLSMIKLQFENLKTDAVIKP